MVRWLVILYHAIRALGTVRGSTRSFWQAGLDRWESKLWIKELTRLMRGGE